MRRVLSLFAALALSSPLLAANPPASATSRNRAAASVDAPAIGIAVTLQDAVPASQAKAAAPIDLATSRAPSKVPPPILAAPESVAPGGGSPSLEGGTVLPLVRASWNVECVATLVHGTLEAELGNDATEARPATLAVRLPAGLDLKGVEVETIDGPMATPVSPDQAPTGTGQGARDRAMGSREQDPRRVFRSTKSFEVPPGGNVVVRLRLSTSATFASGQFRLELASVEAPGAVRAGQADLQLALLVRHEGGFTLEKPLSHPFSTESGTGGTLVQLGAEAVAEDKPIELGWSIGEDDEGTASAWADDPAAEARSIIAPPPAGRTDEAGARLRDVTVLLTAPRHPANDAVRSKNVVFLLDTSGSMARNAKLEQARAALKACLGALRSGDSFGLVRFSSDVGTFRGSPVQAEATPLSEAGAWLDALKASGGTIMGTGLSLAFSQALQGEGHRLVVLLTDGAIQDEREVREIMSREMGDARLLVVAIGSDARKDVIDRLAAQGGGEAVQVARESDLVAAMERLLATFSAPVAWDLAVDWGGARVDSVEPKRLPDLYAERPIVLTARIAGELPEALEVTGATTSGPGTFHALIPVSRP